MPRPQSGSAAGVTSVVMADRDGFEKSSAPVTTLTIVGLASSMLNGLARVPFQRPWKGPAGVVDNLGQAVTRQAIRSFMGYSMGLPIDEFRSMEKVLDDLCRVVIPPLACTASGIGPRRVPTGLSKPTTTSRPSARRSSTYTAVDISAPRP